MSDQPKLEEIDPREGRAPLAVQRAVQELIKHKLDPAAYAVLTQRVDQLITVIFIDRNTRPDPNAIGSRGRVPGFEVVVDEATLEVKKAYFVK